jgi:hypothetical protein
MAWWSVGIVPRRGDRVLPVGRASRGCFTRQAVNIACLQGLTKVRPVRLPVRRRQASRQVLV